MHKERNLCGNRQGVELHSAKIYGYEHALTLDNAVNRITQVSD